LVFSVASGTVTLAKYIDYSFSSGDDFILFQTGIVTNDAFNFVGGSKGFSHTTRTDRTWTSMAGYFNSRKNVDDFTKGSCDDLFTYDLAT